MAHPKKGFDMVSSRADGTKHVYIYIYMRKQLVTQMAYQKPNMGIYRDVFGIMAFIDE